MKKEKRGNQKLNFSPPNWSGMIRQKANYLGRDRKNLGCNVNRICTPT